MLRQLRQVHQIQARIIGGYFSPEWSKISWTSKSMSTTPVEDGFRAPAEWGPHAACLVGWPWRGDLWPHGGRLAQAAFTDVIRAVCKSEKVIVVAKPGTWARSQTIYWHVIGRS